ncbi:helix-turn-helix transcriptional regulator [Streptomyces sp. R302]|uniref:helix-turn-helix transcriptional regulator n=1 Tax=unclassified Streptomyces TaxID=2593676 RepID=UPI00145D4CB8|nr:MULTISPECIES: helix-turn-helix transcriptional regulator [unclassified Streptomyces]NML53432.1 helix-turn-helix transcriptional regulator [Streptomyces sp. R301]NML78386.1 helix-turn-helix transcriptional regulator [Streptomyces sp. R302]
MAPAHVAYGLRAQYGLPVTPDAVAAWERGTLVPSEQELTALAGVLWCSPADLIAVASTLREHRVARGLAVEELARRVGVAAHAYARMEDAGTWKGTERQTAALAEVLGLGPRALITATGGDERLAELLRDAATTRWQAYVKPAVRMLPLPKRVVEPALARLHAEYHAHMAATSSWGASGATGDEGRAYLETVNEHFWAAVGH